MNPFLTQKPFENLENAYLKVVEYFSFSKHFTITQPSAHCTEKLFTSTWFPLELNCCVLRFVCGEACCSANSPGRWQSVVIYCFFLLTSSQTSIFCSWSYALMRFQLRNVPNPSNRKIMEDETEWKFSISKAQRMHLMSSWNWKCNLIQFISDFSRISFKCFPLLFHCRSSRTGSSSPWCWTASSSGSSRSPVSVAL